MTVADGHAIRRVRHARWQTRRCYQESLAARDVEVRRQVIRREAADQSDCMLLTVYHSLRAAEVVAASVPERIPQVTSGTL